MPNFLHATPRHYKFFLIGLKEVAEVCEELNIHFHLFDGGAQENIPKVIKKYNLGAIICDFSPLRIAVQLQKTVLEKLPNDVPLCQVDGHNIVPCWEASDKQEYAARTIRNKLTSKLSTYLTPFPPVIKQLCTQKLDVNIFDWDTAFSKYTVHTTLEDITWIQPGYKTGIEMLDTFCKQRLKIFADKRNDPNADALSNLSPWLHFGQISAQRCILEVNKYKEKYIKSVNVYLEETIIRRELSDNFCFYNPDYDNFNGISNWAKETLNAHRKDKRMYVYTQEQLEKAETHDALWNSAQIQLIKESKIHGFMRMYWAKKILEWTDSPEEAIRIAIFLNDHYSLDGRDPNGYVGVMWSICGIHDQGWAERPIFGKIRYMNYEGCKRKFNVNAYIVRWGGKEYNTQKNETGLSDKNPSPKKKLKTK
ncbi:photorepair [Carabus blaptoides fortunei]